VSVIATLIAADRLSESDFRLAEELLAKAGLRPVSHSWLEPGSACDLLIDTPAQAVRSALDGQLPGVDLVVQPADRRPKRLLVADMDSTMITVECIDELADFAGLKPQVVAVTEAAMHGELDFEAALDARVALLAGPGRDGDRPLPRGAGAAYAQAARAGANDATARRLHPARIRRLHPLCRARSRT
jgi:phosphoserine phosphatase